MIGFIVDLFLWKKHVYTFYKGGSEEQLSVTQWYRPWERVKRLNVPGFEYCRIEDSCHDFVKEEK